MRFECGRENVFNPDEIGVANERHGARETVFVCTIISEGSKIGTGNGGRGRFPVFPP